MSYEGRVEKACLYVCLGKHTVLSNINILCRVVCKTSMKPCQFLCESLFVCMSYPQHEWSAGREEGTRQPVTGAAGDLKGHAVCRSSSHSTPRGNLMFLPAYKSKQIFNKYWHQAWATSTKTKGMNHITHQFSGENAVGACRGRLSELWMQASCILCVK